MQNKEPLDYIRNRGKLNILKESKMDKSMREMGEQKELKRIPVYIYYAQLEKMDEICQKRNKTRRIVMFEAIQTYISLFEKGEV